MSSPDQVFTLTSAISLAGVAAIGLLATAGANILLPKNARCQDRFTFIWLVSGEYYHLIYYRRMVIVKAFDALIHFSFEGSFLYLSTFGRSVNTSTGIFADLCEHLFRTRWQRRGCTECTIRERVYPGRCSLGCFRPNGRIP